MTSFYENKNIKTKNFLQKVTLLFLSQILITIASVLFSHFKALNFFLNPRTDFTPLSPLLSLTMCLIFFSYTAMDHAVAVLLNFLHPFSFATLSFYPPSPFKHPFISFSFVNSPYSTISFVNLFIEQILEIKNAKFKKSKISNF